MKFIQSDNIQLGNYSIAFSVSFSQKCHQNSTNTTLVAKSRYFKSQTAQLKKTNVVLNFVHTVYRSSKIQRITAVSKASDIFVTFLAITYHNHEYGYLVKDPISRFHISFKQYCYLFLKKGRNWQESSLFFLILINKLERESYSLFTSCNTWYAAAKFPVWSMWNK